MLVEAGDLIPGDGEVIEGVASVDESAITGESAPVIRESGGDRSAVTGGTRVLSDWLVVRITANPGETFLDRMIAMVEGAKRQKTPNEIALEHPAGGADHHLPAGVRHAAAVFDLSASEAAGQGQPVTVTVLIALLVCLIPTTIGGLLSAIGIAGMDRMIQANVIADVGPRRRSRRRRGRAAARQDRHDHAGQPPGDGVHPGAGRVRCASWPTPPSLPRLADETPEGRSIVVLAKEQYGLRGRDVHELRRDLRPVHRADAHERRQSRRPRRFAKARPTRSKQYVARAGRRISRRRARQRR